MVKRDLKNLQWKYSNGSWKKTGVLVEFSSLGLHFRALSDVSDADRDDLKRYLYSRVLKRERSELKALQRVVRAFSSCSSVGNDQGSDLKLSDKLKDFIREYFDEEVDQEEDDDDSQPKVKRLNEDEERKIKSQVRVFVQTHADHNWHGRAVARIFHGIASPNFPAKQWGRVFRYWRSYLDVDFNLLRVLAREAILEMRGAR